MISLKLSHALAASINTLPTDAIKALINLEELDISNNRIKNMPDTSFHFLKKLKKLFVQDNIIEAVPKGTFQVFIHKDLHKLNFVTIFFTGGYSPGLGRDLFVF